MSFGRARGWQSHPLVSPTNQLWGASHPTIGTCCSCNLGAFPNAEFDESEMNDAAPRTVELDITLFNESIERLRREIDELCNRKGGCAELQLEMRQSVLARFEK